VCILSILWWKQQHVGIWDWISLEIKNNARAVDGTDPAYKKAITVR